MVCGARKSYQKTVEINMDFTCLIWATEIPSGYMFMYDYIKIWILRLREMCYYIHEKVTTLAII